MAGMMADTVDVPVTGQEEELPAKVEQPEKLSDEAAEEPLQSEGSDDGDFHISCELLMDAKLAQLWNTHLHRQHIDKSLIMSTVIQMHMTLTSALYNLVPSILTHFISTALDFAINDERIRFYKNIAALTVIGVFFCIGVYNLYDCLPMLRDCTNQLRIVFHHDLNEERLYQQHMHKIQSDPTEAEEEPDLETVEMVKQYEEESVNKANAAAGDRLMENKSEKNANVKNKDKNV